MDFDDELARIDAERERNRREMRREVEAKEAVLAEVEVHVRRAVEEAFAAIRARVEPQRIVLQAGSSRRKEIATPRLFLQSVDKAPTRKQKGLYGYGSSFETRVGLEGYNAEGTERYRLSIREDEKSTDVTIYRTPIFWGTLEYSEVRFFLSLPHRTVIVSTDARRSEYASPDALKAYASSEHDGVVKYGDPEPLRKSLARSAYQIIEKTRDHTDFSHFAVRHSGGELNIKEENS